MEGDNDKKTSRRVARKRRKKLVAKDGGALEEVKEEVKVVENIRKVHDATSSELNDAVWDPWFSMPTVESRLEQTWLTVMSGKYF